MTKDKLTAEAKKVLGTSAKVQISSFKASSSERRRAFVSVNIYFDSPMNDGRSNLHVVSYEDTRAKTCDKMFDLLKAFEASDRQEKCTGRRYGVKPAGQFETSW